MHSSIGSTVITEMEILAKDEMSVVKKVVGVGAFVKAYLKEMLGK